MPSRPLRIAFLHLAPRPGDLAHNRRLIERGITAAADLGAAWVLTPELGVCGYTFADRIGTGWIHPQPDGWVRGLCRLAARRRLTLFLSHPERDPRSGRLYNSLFAITPDGAVAGRHRKVNTLRVGSESWSTPGERMEAVVVPPVGPVGLLICADAYSPQLCRSLKAQGVRLLVSAAAWAPGHHGPNGEWERCTEDTGVPLLVCNRTGPDRTLTFTAAESVVARAGARLLSLRSDRSAVFVLDWDLAAQALAAPGYRTLLL